MLIAAEKPPADGLARLEEGAAVQVSSNEINIIGVPVIRVGLLEGYKRIDFHLHGDFRVEDLAGNVVFSNLRSELRWRAKAESVEPAEIFYQVLLRNFAASENASQLVDSLRHRGYPAKWKEIGKIIRIDGELVNDTRKYRVYIGDFVDDTDCDPYLEEFQDEYAPRITRSAVTQSKGIIELFDAEYEYSATVEDGLRLIPQDEDSYLTLYNVRVGTGFHWEKATDRFYSGIMEIRFDLEGGLQAVNEITIDQYLMGVVAAEMPTAFPLEALKAQAVAARSEVLSKLGTKHLNDPFDLCATVHCQVYSGLTNRSPRGDEAVLATQGEALSMNGRICEAVYSSVCGGHTENKENVWNSPGQPYLKGLFDSHNTYSDTINLVEEEDARRWIDSNPKVYCNVDSFDTPVVLNGSRKYFRWEETYTRQELEEIIKEKTGTDLGILFGIELIERGNSGRLIEIELLGSRTNLKIKRELNIRRALSWTHLKSSCFYVTEIAGHDSVPFSFTLHGAGWGHGVGMCQVGAGVMASQGMNYREILGHYYPGTNVKKIYSIGE